jgi:hypothetical protein
MNQETMIVATVESTKPRAEDLTSRWRRVVERRAFLHGLVLLGHKRASWIRCPKLAYPEKV